ncbi:MAG: hypothetical protein ACR2GY_10070 [Phycisphaerales bacterium]
MLINLLLSCVIAGGAQGALDTPESRSDDATAEIVALAMQAHDRRIRAIEWVQSVFVRNHDPETGVAGDWVLRKKGTFGEDSSGNWYYHGSSGKRANIEDEMEYVDEAFTSTPMYAVGWLSGRNEFVIQPPFELPRYQAGPFMGLGRWLEITGTRRLSEILLESDMLRVHEVDEAKGRVTLAAEAVVSDQPCSLLITVDRQYSYAPVIIRRYNAAYNALAEEIINTEFQRIDDVWIPTAGTRAMFTRGRLTEAQSRKFKASVAGHASEMSLAETDPAVTRAAALELFGDGGWPVTLLADVMTSFSIHEVLSVNAGLRAELFRVRVPPTALVTNAMNGLHTRMTSIDAVVAGFDLIVLEDEPVRPWWMRR